MIKALNSTEITELRAKRSQNLKEERIEKLSKIAIERRNEIIRYFNTYVIEYDDFEVCIDRHLEDGDISNLLCKYLKEAIVDSGFMLILMTTYPDSYCASFKLDKK